MATSDPLEILLTHDKWATRQIIHACEPLTPEQFHRRFEIGPGSLHDSIEHILGAMRVWSDLLAGREQRLRLEVKGSQRSIEEFLELLEESAADFRASAKGHPVEDVVTRERDGKLYSYTRGAVITHVVTHGMHHRAQCLNMLRQLGISPLPASSVAEWARTADLQQ